MYTTTHAALIFGCSVETIRLWAMEFQAYLSPNANPGKGRMRQFSDDDMRVLALVATMRKSKSPDADIHASLRNNERGEIPALTPEEINTLALSGDRAVSAEIAILNRQLEKVQAELESALERAEQADVLKEENIRLQTTVDLQHRQIEKLEERLSVAMADALDAQRQLGMLQGELKAKNEKSPE